MPRADRVKEVWNQDLPSGLQGEQVELMEHLQRHLWRREEDQEEGSGCPLSWRRERMARAG